MRGRTIQHGFLLALTATFWKPVAHYNKGNLSIHVQKKHSKM